MQSITAAGSYNFRINMEHFYENIQGWNGQLVNLYESVVPELPENACVVEIGAWAGRSTAHLAVLLINSGKPFELNVVDHWQGSTEPYYQDPAVKQRDIYNEFLDNMAPVIDHLTIHRMSSVEAAEKFADASLDWVIIDDDHNYEFAKASVQAWLPKVKPGGFISGDDHHVWWRGVIDSCREQFGSDYWIITEKGEMISAADSPEEYGAWFKQV